MNNKTDEIEAKEEKERKAQVGGVNIPSSPFPPGSRSTNNPLWRGAAFRWESFDLRGAGSSPRYESSSREGEGKVCRRPRTALLVPFVIFFRWSAQETSASWPIRNILRISSPPSTLLEGYPVRGSRERHTRLAFSPKRKLVIDTATRSKKRERGWEGKFPRASLSGVGWWASIKTYFAKGGPSDVNNLALVSFVIIAVTSIWEGVVGKSLGKRGRGGVLTPFGTDELWFHGRCLNCVEEGGSWPIADSFVFSLSFSKDSLEFSEFWSLNILLLLLKNWRQLEVFE